MILRGMNGGRHLVCLTGHDVADQRFDAPLLMNELSGQMIQQIGVNAARARFPKVIRR